MIVVAMVGSFAAIDGIANDPLELIEANVPRLRCAMPPEPCAAPSGSPYFRELRRKVRAQLAARQLFPADGVSSVGRGTGRPCTVGGHPIDSPTLEREVEGPGVVACAHPALRDLARGVDGTPAQDWLRSSPTPSRARPRAAHPLRMIAGRNRASLRLPDVKELLRRARGLEAHRGAGPPRLTNRGGVALFRHVPAGNTYVNEPDGLL